MNYLLRRMRTMWGQTHRASGYAWLLAPLTALLLQLMVLLPLQPSRPINNDPDVFMYGGNLLAEGYAPYLYLWDIKPPLIFDLTALISLLAPGQPWTQFYIASFLTGAVTVGIVGLATHTVYRRTASTPAALSTGGLITGYQYYFSLPRFGPWPKLYAILFGLLCIHFLFVADRPIAATVSGTLSAGFWPFGVVFVVVSFVEAHRRRQRIETHLVALAGVALLASLPIILTGGFVSMVNEVIFASLTKGDGGATVYERVRQFYSYTAFTWTAYYIGTLGGVYHAVQRREDWWVGAVLAWSLVQLAFLDFDFVPDPMLFVAFAAIGLGMIIGRLRPDQQLLAVSAVAVLVVLHVFPVRQLFLSPPPTDPGGGALVRHFLEQKIPPSHCEISRGHATRVNGEPITKCGTDGPL